MRSGMLRLTPGPGDAAPARRGRGPARRGGSGRTLAQEAAGRGLVALGIADENNLFGAVKFHKACARHGIKPVVGCDLTVGLGFGNERDRAVTALALCQDRAGYANLCRIVSDAHGRAVRERTAPCADLSRLGRADWEGLVVLSGWSAGEVGRHLAAGDLARARKAAGQWAARLGGDRFCVEVQRAGFAGEEGLVEAHLRLADEMGLPVVCTHPAQFLDPEDFEAHEVRACIYEGWHLDDADRPRPFRESQYLKSAAEMARLFADIPEAVSNTVEVARRCNFRFEFGEVRLPSLGTPERAGAPGGGLRERAQAGLARVTRGMGDREREAYEERLRHEVGTIEGMGFSDYFLIVAHIVDWAKANGVPVGPGRGSGAGSLVAYVLGITGLDPIRHGLLFERFLNPERVSMPDFDIDFCQENRERLIQHVRERFGADCVSQICTFGTLGAKAAVRSVGRALGMPYGKCDQIARLIPFALDMTLEQARRDSEELRQLVRDDAEVARMFELAAELEGLPRNVSTHAGGLLIAPDRLVNHCPLYATEDTGGFASQFDKDDVESIGLVKFDFLGLTTLTIIAEAARNVEALSPGHGFDPEGIPLDDAEVYRLYSATDTVGVFQGESAGMRELMRRLEPDRFDDIVALLALFRPGPLESGMAESYIERKHDPSRIEWIHDSLREVLGDTRGVVVYQEQVMRIAQVLADYSLGEADLLRRAMGKKKPEEMAPHRERFMKVAGARLKDGATGAARLFDQLEKFAGYGFNKSHAAAYALLSVRTAWLKVHHPAAFFAAALSNDMNSASGIRKLIGNATASGVAVLPPDVNHSAHRFSVVGPWEIRFGLGAVKGVGRLATDELVRVRGEGGPFRDLEDFLARTRRIAHLNRKALEMLAKAGALDSVNANRAQTLEFLGMRGEGGEHVHGQESLFEGQGLGVSLPQVDDWDQERRLAQELDAIGVTISGHFFDAYRPWIERYCRERITPIKDLRDDATATIAGVMVKNVSTRGAVRKGLDILMLDDTTDTVDVLVEHEQVRQCPELLREGALVIARGRRVQRERPEPSFRAERAWDRDRWVAEQVRLVEVELHPGSDDFGPCLTRLGRMLRGHANGGACRVRVRCAAGRFRCDIDLGERWRVNPSADLMRHLEEAVGQECVRPGG